MNRICSANRPPRIGRKLKARARRGMKLHAGNCQAMMPAAVARMAGVASAVARWVTAGSMIMSCVFTAKCGGSRHQCHGSG